MSDLNHDVMHLLGRIDGKLDQVINSAEEHRADDKRRFAEVHGRLDEHAKDINVAKGASSVIRWLIGGGIVSIIASVAAIMKVFG